MLWGSSFLGGSNSRLQRQLPLFGTSAEPSLDEGAGQLKQFRRVASLCICVKVRGIRWIQKTLKGRLFFSHCMSGKRALCSREKLQERKDVTCGKGRNFLGKAEVDVSSFPLVFPSCCLSLPKQARAAVAAFHLLR